MEGSTLEAPTKGKAAAHDPKARRVIVCAGTGCVANGSRKVLAALEQQMAAAGLDVVLEFRAEGHGDGVRVSHSGCQGFCQMGPLVTILPENILYTKVTVDDVPDIVNLTLIKGEPVEHLLYVEPHTKEKCLGPDQIPFYQRQRRMVLKECGFIDPDEIREYVAHGGYDAARKAFTEMDAKGVCEVIAESGLRGRGGGGFPTGRKWEAARIQDSPKKYVICNGDEGDPGAFMDRSVMEGNPHCVIEGMLIAARGIGADEGYIYVRAEYPLAVKRMRKAIGRRRSRRLPRRRPLRLRPVVSPGNHGRRGRVRLRRGDGA
ncbi:MAG: NAD(P)H-dependent oxidoreductase subunit E [Solidesulfovibrio sp.]